MAIMWDVYARAADPIAKGIGATLGDLAERSQAEELMLKLQSGMGQPQQTLASLSQPQPIAPMNPGNATTSSLSPPGNFPASLVKTESGGNWAAQNNVMGAGGKVGHFGRLQFGQARLQDAMNAGAIPQGTTPQAFMASPELQKRAEAWHFADIDRNIANGPARSAIGTTINGVPVTQDGLRAVAHLGGVGGMNKFVETGGRYNPSDANGTSLMSYLQQHAGQAKTNPLANVAPMQGGQAQQAQQAPVMTLAQVAQASPQIDMQTLSAAMQNKYTAPIAQALLMKQLGRDPIEQQMNLIKLQQAQMGLSNAPLQQQMLQEQLRSSQLANQRAQAELSGDGAKVSREVQQRASALSQMGIDPRSPEGQQYALTGKLPENFNGGGEFGKALDKKNADMVSELVSQKGQSQSDLADIETLKGLVKNVPAGFFGRTMASAANKTGIETAGGVALQQFEAIVSRLVPAQRQPGSGTMSDRDVDLFKSSLPSLMGTPEGNSKIIATMEGVARYKAAQSDIATAIATGRVKKDEGLKMLNSLPNPLEWVRKSGGGQAQKGAKPQGADLADVMKRARDSIASGASREAVIQRLRENGIDPAGL